MDLDNKALELAKQLGTPDHIKSIDIDDDRLQVYIDELKIQLPGLDEDYYKSHALARLSHFVACDGGNPELQNEKGAAKLADAKQRDYLKDIATDGLASIKNEIIGASINELEVIKNINNELKNIIADNNKEINKNLENITQVTNDLQINITERINTSIEQLQLNNTNFNEKSELILSFINNTHKDIIKGIALTISVLGTLLLAILLATIFAPKAKAQVDLLSLQNNGSQVKLWAGGKAIVNCDGSTVTCTWDAANKRVTIASVSGGAGTVVSVGNVTLTGLFVCTVSNPTTTPTWSCAASSAAAHTFWGNNTGAGTAGSFVQPACADLSDNNTGCNHLAPAALANASHKWLNSYTQSTGLFTQTQPACGDLSNGGTLCLSSAALAATLANSANKWFNSYDASTGLFTQTQPGCSNLSGAAAHCGTDASELSANTVPTARLGSGAASNTTFLRGDQTWATPAGSGGGTTVTVAGSGLADSTGNLNATTPAAGGENTNVTFSADALSPTNVSAALIAVVQAKDHEGSALTQRKTLDARDSLTIADSGGNTTIDYSPLDARVVHILEEFTSGDSAAATGNFQENWLRLRGPGSGTLSQIPGVWPNIGIGTVNTTTTANDCTLAYKGDSGGATPQGFSGNLAANVPWGFQWIFKIPVNTGSYRVGMSAATAPSGSCLIATDLIGVRWVSGTDTTNFQFTMRQGSGTETTASTGVAIDTGWHTLNVTSTSAGVVNMCLDSAACVTGGTGQTLNIAVPTVAMSLAGYVINESSGTTARVLQMDKAAFWARVNTGSTNKRQ